MSNAALQTETQAPTTELVLLSSVPAKIQFNLQEFRQNIRNELKKYDLVVTVDTVKDAKALAADLNGQAKSLKDHFKEAAALVTKPVDDLGLEVAEIVAEILESREKLTAQIKKFEDERKVIVRNVLEAKRLELWDSLEVAEEFRDAPIDKLVKLTALTAKDSLTSTTLRDLQSLIDANRRLQDQTEKRLLMLENQSYKEGLKAPLTREHVESFLFEPEASYAGKLAHMMVSELKRQAATEEAARRQFEAEQQRAEQQRAEQQRVEQNLQQEQQHIAQQSAPPHKDELQAQIKQAKEALPYAEGSYREDQQRINAMERQLSEMERPVAQQVSATLDFIITPAGDVSTCLSRMTVSPQEIFQAALSESHSIGARVDIWEKHQGHVAIADASTGRVFVWEELTFKG